jgi:hypothetical protein
VHHSSQYQTLIDDVYCTPTDALTPAGTRPSAALRRYAAACGHAGREGGWIYDSNDRPLEQGWWNYAWRALRQIGRKHTGELPADLARARAELRDYVLKRSLERQSR